MGTWIEHITRQFFESGLLMISAVFVPLVVFLIDIGRLAKRKGEVGQRWQTYIGLGWGTGIFSGVLILDAVREWLPVMYWLLLVFGLPLMICFFVRYLLMQKEDLQFYGSKVDEIGKKD